MTVDKPTPGNLIATVSELVDSTNNGNINGVTVSGTPGVGDVITATSASTATWQAGGGGGGGGGSEFIVASSLYSPADWLPKAAYVCDGTDDDVQIQAALDAAGTIGGGGVGGGKVLLAPGFYFIAADLSMADNVTIEGADFNPVSTQLALQGTKIAAAVANKYCGLKNLTVLGYLAIPASGPLVDFENNHDSLIENVAVSVAGVTLDTTTNSLMNIGTGFNSRIKGLKISGAYDFPIGASNSNALVNVTGTGGDISGLSDTTLNAGNVSLSTDPFVGFRIGANNASVKSVYVAQGATFMGQGSYTEFSGIYVGSGQGYGIYLQVDHADIHGCVVQFAGNGAPGFYDGIAVIGDLNHVYNNTVEQSVDALNGLHIQSGTNNVVNNNFLVAGASGANFQDDGITTRTNSNYTT